MRKHIGSPATLLWLTCMWVLLWGDITIGNIAGGLLAALTVTALMPLPRTPFNWRFRPLGLLALALVFARDTVVASWQVARFAVGKKKPRGAVIRVALRGKSDFYMTMTAGMTALVPGSIVVEAHRRSGTLYIHVMDVDTAGGLDQARRTVLVQEERIMRALASAKELEDAGYAPGWRRSAGRVAR